jgi:hypothetical protein
MPLENQRLEDALAPKHRMIIDLKSLPSEHPLRNTPLGEIRAEIRNIWQTRWRSIQNWKIAKNTFNELGSVWTECSQWRVSQ